MNFTLLEKNHLHKSIYRTRNSTTVRSSYQKTQVSCHPLQIHSSAPARLSHTTSWYDTGHTRTYHKGHRERTQMKRKKKEQWNKYTQCGCFGMDDCLSRSSEIFTGKVSPLKWLIRCSGVRSPGVNPEINAWHKCRYNQ